MVFEGIPLASCGGEFCEFHVKRIFLMFCCCCNGEGGSATFIAESQFRDSGGLGIHEAFQKLLKQLLFSTDVLQLCFATVFCNRVLPVCFAIVLCKHKIQEVLTDAKPKKP